MSSINHTISAALSGPTEDNAHMQEKMRALAALRVRTVYLAINFAQHSLTWSLSAHINSGQDLYGAGQVAGVSRFLEQIKFW